MTAVPTIPTIQQTVQGKDAASLLQHPSPRRIESRLDSLTALRFIAAAMIVVSHSAGKFNMDPRMTIENLPLAQGVSFFFVLSGFILTYVYRDLSGFKQTLHFLAARIARVWPVFFFSGVATYFLTPGFNAAENSVRNNHHFYQPVFHAARLGSSTHLLLFSGYSKLEYFYRILLLSGFPVLDRQSEKELR